MPPQIALLLATGFILFAFYTDRKRRGGNPSELLWPTLWYLIVASRVFGFWLDLWGVPLPGGSGNPEDGSVVDRNFFLFLIIMGMSVLVRRRFDWAKAMQGNSWFTALLVFMLLSLVWSDYPYVSFKRFVKVFGSMVMAFVVLSHENPLEATFAVIRRCLYIHLPMSIVCIKYFRDIGVAYDWSGSSQMWQGIATSKNTLGQVAALGVVYFAFEIYRNWRRVGWKNFHVLYLLMSLHLLKGAFGSVSKTSIAVAAFACLAFFGMQALRANPQRVRLFVNGMFASTLGLVLLILDHSVSNFSADSPFGQVIALLGRDTTLTDRTYIWSDMYAEVDNPLLGVGFGGFWIGRIANIPWSATMSWVLGQGHNGYIDTYLQTGLIGGFLLVTVVFTTLPRLLKSLPHAFDFGALRITLLLTILFINNTESTLLRGDHHMWFLFQLVVWPVVLRRPVKPRSGVPQRSAQGRRSVPADRRSPIGERADTESVFLA